MLGCSHFSAADSHGLPELLTHTFLHSQWDMDVGGDGRKSPVWEGRLNPEAFMYRMGSGRDTSLCRPGCGELCEGKPLIIASLPPCLPAPLPPSSLPPCLPASLPCHSRHFIRSQNCSSGCPLLTQRALKRCEAEICPIDVELFISLTFSTSSLGLANLVTTVDSISGKALLSAFLTYSRMPCVLLQ